MAVELYDLYKEIYREYDVKLLTTSCFNKEIDWMHFIENDEFAYLLHGGELLFNSSLNFESDDVRRRFIDKYFENECHLANTADALFFHKNTLKYKLAKIRDILGYDVNTNENRMNIMLALKIQKL